MDEEYGAAEIIRDLSEENQTRKILDIIKNSKSIDDAIERVRALLPG
ncbi:MAG: protein phosphatase [Clostridiales bacterium]|nr:protein phosphatase [Clostridiales bacterium]